jgi:alpha-tubulin suppressor-like RCC1 family protein
VQRLTVPAFVLPLVVALACQQPRPPTAPPTDPALGVTAAHKSLSFRQVSVGVDHTCVLTDAGVAYCWGSNLEGQLGNSTTIRRLRSVRVASQLTFRQVNAGAFHTCGVTTGYLAYCWGNNELGQLGDGTTINRPRPVAVAPPAR